MASSDWIGKVVGNRYHIEKLLGKGGMAAVFQATDQRLDRVIAIKIIHNHLSDSDQFIKRFQREAASVAKLHHPNIVQVYDFNEHEGTYFIVFEFVPGDTLQSHLKTLNDTQTPMPFDKVIAFSTSMADALAYAHDHGVIHRDIKPGNILLGPNDRVVLTDFGLAKIAGGTRYTMTGAVMGTARYMSPEQIKSDKIDARTDIYSLGVTMFEMLSGRPPFEAETAVTTMMMHLNNPIPNIQDLRPNIPPWLILVIEKTLAKSPDNRYQSAAELLHDLRQQQFGALSIDSPAPIPITQPDVEPTIVASSGTTQVSPTPTVTQDHPTPTPAPQPTPPASTSSMYTIAAQQTATNQPTQPPPKKWRGKTPLLAFGAVALLFLFGFIFITQIMPNLSGPQIVADGGTPDVQATGSESSGLAGAAVNVDDDGQSGNSIALIEDSDSNDLATIEPTDTNTPPTATTTATNTPRPTNTSRPTATSTAASTATATNTNTPRPTDTPRSTNTPNPSATPLSENPTGLPRSGPGVPNNFENFGVWVIGDEQNGSFLPSSTQRHDGTTSAKLSYDFTTSGNDYVVFMQTNTITGEPNALQLWVYGDSSAHFLNAWIQDNDGQTWQVPFGQVTHTGWKQMTALIDTTQDWPWTSISGPDNGIVDYPIKFRAFVLDDYSNGYTGAGVIYLDSLTATTVTGIINDAPTATAAPQPTNSSAAPSSTPAPATGDLGRIIYTSGTKLYTTDPSWTSPKLIGDAVSDSCSSPATTADQTINLNHGIKCGVGDTGAGVCTSPNGQYDVITNAIDSATTSIVVEPVGSDNGQFIYQGSMDRTEGIRWSPTSNAFLFVVGNTVYRAYPNGSYNQIIEMAFQPIFSSDGSLILYRKPVGPGVNDVFVSNADGSNPRNVSNQINVDSKCAAWVN